MADESLELTELSMAAKRFLLAGPPRGEVRISSKDNGCHRDDEASVGLQLWPRRRKRRDDDK